MLLGFSLNDIVDEWKNAYLKYYRWYNYLQVEVQRLENERKNIIENIIFLNN